jgi:hypothetical protein
MKDCAMKQFLLKYGVQQITVNFISEYIFLSSVELKRVRLRKNVNLTARRLSLFDCS